MERVNVQSISQKYLIKKKKAVCTDEYLSASQNKISLEKVLNRCNEQCKYQNKIRLRLLKCGPIK